MSKKNRNKFGSSSPAPAAPASPAQLAEYKIIRHDLIRVVIMNVIFFGLMLALYYTNQQSQYLERWFSRFF
jgi:hypothetical protein